jgi:hypothetical protein
VGLVLTPSAGGTRSGSLVITASTPGSPHTVTLSGTGTIPVTLTPVPGFKDVPVGQTGVQTVTLSNATAAPTTITGITFVGTNAAEFSADASGCSGNVIPAAGSCTIQLSFTPAATGTRSATMRVATAYSTFANEMTTFGVGVTNPGLTLSTTSVAFGNRTVDTDSVLTFSISNPNGVAIAGLSLVKTGGTEFTLFPATDCTSSLAVGASCTVSVTFHPASKGNKSGSVTVSWTGMAASKVVFLTGKGQ